MASEVLLWHGDCLELMKQIPVGSVDLILCDPPYGIMKYAPTNWKQRGETAAWDTPLSTAEMYENMSMVLRRNGKAVLFCQEPYTSELITSVPPSMLFCYRGIWLKNRTGNSMMAKTAMVSLYEDFCVFTNKATFGEINACCEKITDFIMQIGADKIAQVMQLEGRYKCFASAKRALFKKMILPGWNGYDNNFFDEAMYQHLEKHFDMPYTFDEYFKIVAEYKRKTSPVFNLWQGRKTKPNVLQYAKDNDNFHVTQKPVLLLEDLIKTYSNEGDTVLDFTMGSGSTGVACMRTGRRFIGIEKDPRYFHIAEERIRMEADNIG